MSDEFLTLTLGIGFVANGIFSFDIKNCIELIC